MRLGRRADMNKSCSHTAGQIGVNPTALSNQKPKPKLNVKFTIRLSEQENENFDYDISVLAKQVIKQAGIRIKRSAFLRLCLEDLHEKILSKDAIVWPPRLETSAWAAAEQHQAESEATETEPR
jgi:hypothetical protein